MSSIVGLFSRRNLLVGLGGAAATAGVAQAQANGSAAAFGQLFKPTAPGSKNADLKTGSYGDWSAQVGSSFTTHSGHVLKLVEVQGFANKGARPVNLRQQAFVAGFDIIRGSALPEGLYRVSHPGGAVFDMFLTKGGPANLLRMNAVFN